MATYDGAKRPVGLDIANGGNPIAALARTYDRAGNAATESQTLAGISGLAGSGVQTFSYDAVNRLTSSSVGSDSRGYTYDAGSRRLTATVNSVTITNAYDRSGAPKTETVGIDTEPFVYDAYGNLTSRPIDHLTGSATSFTYDVEDHLLSAASGGGSGESYAFTVDALGRPWTRTANGGGSPDSTYGYLGSSDSSARITGVTTTIDAELDPGGGRLATVTSTSSAFLVADLHGNLSATLAISGTSITGGTRYDAFGVAIADSATSVPRPWGYQGRLNLLEGSTQARVTLDFGAREYQPDLGQFTGFDSVAGSIASPLTLNRYLYAGANPATLVDPDGHRFENGIGADVHGSGFSTYRMRPAQIREARASLREQNYSHYAGGRYARRTAEARRIQSVQQAVARNSRETQRTVDDALSAGASSAAISFASVLAIGTVCGLTAGFGCGLAVGLGLGLGVVGTTQTATTVLDSRNSDHDRWEAAASFAGGLLGGGAAARAVPIRLGLNTESVAGDGPVVFRPYSGATAQEMAQFRAYCAMCNDALRAGVGQGGRVSTAGALRAASNRAAAAERARASLQGAPYLGQAGHVPDTTWSGSADPFAWLDLAPRVNQSLGGQAAHYRIGYRPTEFIFDDSQ